MGRGGVYDQGDAQNLCTGADISDVRKKDWAGLRLALDKMQFVVVGQQCTESVVVRLRQYLAEHFLFNGCLPLCPTICFIILEGVR